MTRRRHSTYGTLDRAPYDVFTIDKMLQLSPLFSVITAAHHDSHFKLMSFNYSWISNFDSKYTVNHKSVTFYF